MNDNMLNDLASKIKNIVHDFELEYDLPIRVGVSVEATRIVIETQMAESRPVSAMKADDRPQMDEPAQDTDQMETPLTTSRAGYQYDDAPGQVFASPEEHAAWQRQQNRRSRG